MSVAWYSLVQYMPCSMRQETINIGLVLLCPERNYLETLLDENTEKVLRVFPKMKPDPEQFDLMRLSTKRRLEIDRDKLIRLEEFDHYVATRCNSIRLTPRRGCSIYSDTKAEHQAMFEKLVLDP